ncbi:Pex19 protein [Metschnikowia bicuspidata]|uniref:Pex19 protein n=1 Tax=Metschnikowia bicuspidata TaxID=27322 RepID=A0A4V1J3L7_9ASCO|nr:Pex19 protein [Metschnikowia bicuspidata]
MFEPQNQPHDSDSDLDDLLDEFDEQVFSKPPGGTPAEAPPLLKTELQHDIEGLIKDLNIEDPQAKSQFEELVKQFEEVHAKEAAAAQDPENFDAVMKDTMERLKKSGKNIDEQLKNDPAAANPEFMLTQLLAGLGNGSDGDLDMSKLLTSMLELLSSKDVLYEPIKDLNTKFPAYLEEQKDKLSADEHERYTKQYEITNDIVAVFEGPSYDNDNTEHREKINTFLESLQELGNPPAELVGDEKNFPGFGGLGGDRGLDFDSKDLPANFEKELEDGCKQT